MMLQNLRNTLIDMSEAFLFNYIVDHEQDTIDQVVQHIDAGQDIPHDLLRDLSQVLTFADIGNDCGAHDAAHQVFLATLGNDYLDQVG